MLRLMFSVSFRDFCIAIRLKVSFSSSVPIFSCYRAALGIHQLGLSQSLSCGLHVDCSIALSVAWGDSILRPLKRTFKNSLLWFMVSYLQTIWSNSSHGNSIAICSFSMQAYICSAVPFTSDVPSPISLHIIWLPLLSHCSIAE